MKIKFQKLIKTAISVVKAKMNNVENGGAIT